MPVGKIMIACWVVFIVVTGALRSIWTAILGIHALSHSTAVALALLVIVVLWGGSFGYAMYLAFAAIRNGDRRLLKRGVAGTALVLSRKMTNTSIQSGGYDWQAPRVYKYRLRVSLPGKAPYETSLSICAAGIHEGSTVTVAASRHNRRRVTVDVGQGTRKQARNGASVRRPAPAFSPPPAFSPAAQDFRGAGPAFADLNQAGPTPGRSQGADAERLNMLAQLGQLHRQGVLTDAEFAAQKAQILSE
jgi:putative oligomerization/nucleic acid binding protein